MIVILGDIHFRDDKDYFCQICEKFLEWFDTWELNTPENTLLLAGDLVERNLLTGKVADYLERFAKYSKFQAVHVCVGNHDLKTVYNEAQLAYEFYRNKDTFHLYTEITPITVEGQRILILPYYTGQNPQGLTMPEFYSNLWRNPVYNMVSWDLVLGHFSAPDTGFGSQVDVIDNLEKLDVKKVCLGHIHTRFADPGKYIGSVFAGKKGENDPSRAAWYFADGWKEYRLPKFNEFLEVSYPDPLPRTDALVPIYTVLNCANELIAREKYGNIALRKTTPAASDFSKQTLVNFDDRFLSIKNMKQDELFRAFIQENPDLPSDVIIECKEALGIV